MFTTRTGFIHPLQSYLQTWRFFLILLKFFFLKILYGYFIPLRFHERIFYYDKCWWTEVGAHEKSLFGHELIL